MKETKKENLHVKTGDRVIVISGKDKGKVGNIKNVLTADNKVVVEGVNMITKAMKPNPMAGIQGGLIKMESPLAASKVMFHASTDKLSSFAVGVDKIKPKKRSSSSSSQETSVWLTAAPTPEPTPEPTPTPTIEPPAVVPLKPVTQTPESPVPFAGIAAGLFAAAVLCGMRRR